MLELLEAAPADLQLHSAFEPDRVVPAGIPDESLDQIQADDCGAMDPEESGGIEPLLERLHPLAYQIPLVPNVQFRVRSARDQVIDLLDGDDADLPTHLDSDPLQVLLLHARSPLPASPGPQ